LGEVEIVLGHGLGLGEPRLVQPPLESSLAGGPLAPDDQRGQDLQHGAAFAAGLIEHFAVALGDLRQLQLGQVTFQPRLEIVVTSSMRVSLGVDANRS